MGISQRILKLKQDASAITSHPLLDAIDIDRLRSFEEQSETNTDYKRKLNTLSRILEGLSFEYNKKFQDIYNIYNELLVYELLSSKVQVEIVREDKSRKTSDYKLISAEGKVFYSDLKTLHYVNGNLNYLNIQQQGVDSKIELEQQMQTLPRKSIYFSEPVIHSPFRKGNNFDHYNSSVIIEALIDKAVANYKPEQINYLGNGGIYLVDVTQMLIPNDLEQGLPIIRGTLYKELVSGILWNVAFGELNDPTYNWVEFAGKPNIGRRLNRTGLLKDDNIKDLKAVAFVVGYDNSSRRIIGFYRTWEKDVDLVRMLYTICDFVNNETNSEYYELLDKKAE